MVWQDFLGIWWHFLSKTVSQDFFGILTIIFLVKRKIYIYNYLPFHIFYCNLLYISCHICTHPCIPSCTVLLEHLCTSCSKQSHTHCCRWSVMLLVHCLNAPEDTDLTLCLGSWLTGSHIVKPWGQEGKKLVEILLLRHLHPQPQEKAPMAEAIRSKVPSVTIMLCTKNTPRLRRTCIIHSLIKCVNYSYHYSKCTLCRVIIFLKLALKGKVSANATS